MTDTIPTVVNNETSASPTVLTIKDVPKPLPTPTTDPIVKPKVSAADAEYTELPCNVFIMVFVSTS